MSRWATAAPWRAQPGKGQNVPIGAASVQSTAVGIQTHAVRISALGNCHVEIGPNPIATVASPLVKASDFPLEYACTPGDKVAVIQDGTGTGNCNIVELTH